MKTIIYQLCCTAILMGLALTSRSQTINTFAGNAGLGAGYSGDGGAAVIAQLNHPKCMVVDDTGNVYIADAYNNMIRKVDPAGNISTFSGVLAGGYAGDGSDATYAAYDHPNYVALDAAHNMYICDPNNARIRKIDHATNIITTIVGDGNPGYLGDGGPATAAEINGSSAIALDSAGNLYIADAGNNVIRKVNTSGTISTIAGIFGSFGYSGDGGPATAASVDMPYGLAFDRAGNLYVSLYFDSRICKISPSGIITSYAGVGGGGGGGISGDNGPATAAIFDSPWGIATDGRNNLYIADNANNRVRKVTPSGIVTTFAGTGTHGILGDGGPATAAQMKDPVGLATGPDGSVYIADYNNHTVRIVYGPSTHPPTFAGGHRATMAVCANAPFRNIDAMLTVHDIDTGQTETWSVVLAPTHGTLAAAFTAVSTGSNMTPSGLGYTVAHGYAGADSFKVRIYDGTASDTTTVVVTITPCIQGPLFAAGHTQTLTACENSAAIPLTVPLSVTDTSLGETVTWSTVTAPAHGTLVASYSTTSTGATLPALGLSYMPATGYTGSDLFRVGVTDGLLSDTTTVNVTVTTCPTGIPGVTTAGNGLNIFPNPNTGAFTVTVSAGSNIPAHLIITNVLGEKVKEADIMTNNPADISINEPAGIYLINASAGNERWSTRITIRP